MTSVLFTIGGTAMNALVFSGTKFFFVKLTHHGKKKRKRDKWNEDRMKQLDFINKRLHKKSEARAYINNIEEGMLEYYRVFAKEIKPLPPEP